VRISESGILHSHRRENLKSYVNEECVWQNNEYGGKMDRKKERDEVYGRRGKK
jgi:hypothetical protein